ncbi:PREDICTED: cytochrome P450 71A1-like [Lupinus angustifolius]|nr:PREDICTED: cytochrome P450 71A1-like [Lupinus angustifolius]
MALKQWTYEQIKEVFFSTLHLSFFFIISILFLFKFSRRTISKLNLPPSPPKLPIIGHLHLLGSLPHRSLQKLSHNYGDMMFLQLGQMQTPTLVVSSGDVAMEIMKNHDLNFSNRPQFTAPKILLYGCNDVAFGLCGENWRNKRKILVLQLLSSKRVQSFSHIREEEVEEWIKKLREVSLSDACSVNISDMFMSIANNIVCKCALGRKFSASDDDGNNKVKELARKVTIQLAAFTVRDYFSWLGWVDVLTGKIEEYKDTFRQMDTLLDEVIEEHKKVEKEGNNYSRMKDFVDILLQLQANGKLDFELTNNDLKPLLMDMFVGGTDTTATVLEWTFVELMKNPIIMKKSQEEVRRVIGKKSKVEENDIDQMPYLKCVIKESLRLHPSAPLILPRETISSLKLNGYDIPAKTMVYINAWAIHNDPKLWKSPKEFIPERFENNDVDFKGQHSQFIPFGFGRRGCPGMIFGNTSVEYVLASLLYWFDWKLPETYKSIDDIDMGEIFGLITSKKEPLHLKPIAFSL